MSPVSGPRVDLSVLLFPELADARSEVIRALQALGGGDYAAAVLGLGKKSAEDAALNLALETAPCAPAIELYTGVLYDHLDAATLAPDTRARLEGSTWIASGLFGVVRTTDLLPNHRLAVGTKLPGIGSLAAWWRPRLRDALPDLAGETIIDCRSGGYRAAYPAAEAHVVEIAVVEERAAGRKVITHMAKKWRGLAVRHLVEVGGEPLDALTRLGARPEILDVEIAAAEPTRAGGSTTRVTLVTASTET